MFRMHKKIELPAAHEILPGRAEAIEVTDVHFVHGHPLTPPFPIGMEQALFGLGCFWGAEKCFWQMSGVYTTAVGYAGGGTPNPCYEEVCSGMTGHNEVVFVVFDPTRISYLALLKVFWQAHDPTQGMRQGNDRGTQYRSGIYYYSAAQQDMAETTQHQYQNVLRQAGFADITTEILAAPEFYYAEPYHQQYLAKTPHGYCGLGGTGVEFPE